MKARIKGEVRYLAALSAARNWAWKELGWIPANPVLSVAKGPEHTGIVRYLSDDERQALLAACKTSTDPSNYCAVMLTLATGTRASRRPPRLPRRLGIGRS